MTTSYFVSSCPEAVSAITVNSPTLALNGALVNFVNETFAADLNTPVPPRIQTVGGHVVLMLEQYPISNASVQLFLNSGVQIPATHFTVNGQYVILEFTPDIADTVFVHYMAYAPGDASSAAEIAVGAMMAWAGATPPPGWCLCDGVTSYTMADYPALYAVATANSLVLSTVVGVSFVLRELKSVKNEGGLLVTVGTIIKA